MTQRQPSFRGVSFNQQSDELRGGRRGQRYEYPNRERGGYLDLGQKIATIDVRGYYTGEQPLEDWKILRQALDNPRPGELITYMGDRFPKAHCVDYTYSHGVRKGLNITYFTLKFIDANDVLLPQVSGNVRGVLQRATADTEAAVQTSLLDKLWGNIPDYRIPKWAKDILTGDYQNYFDEYVQAYNEVAGVVNTIETRLEEFGFLEATKTRNNVINATGARKVMRDIQTPSQQRQSPIAANSDIDRAVNANQQIVYSAGDVMGLVGVANVLLEEVPESKEAAESYRQEYNQATNYVLGSITDAPLYRLLTDQQAAVNQFIAGEIIKLPEERMYKAEFPLPALVVANRFAGDNKGDIVALQSDIITRNAIKDPLQVREATWLNR